MARIIATPSERGEHTFRVICADQDGVPVGQEMKGDFSISPEGGAGNVVVVTELILPRLTKYRFSLSVDGHEMDTWPLEAKEIASTQAK